MGLSRQGVASCCHHDTYLYYNQRQPICLRLEAGLGGCTGNLLSMPHKLDIDFRTRRIHI